MKQQINLNTKILYRSLKIIEEIYDEAQYGIDDLYRIKDIVHCLDENHWVGKQWLVDSLKPIHDKLFPNTSKMYIAGGWYGLLAHLLRDNFPDNHIVCADMDPMTEHFGHKLFYDRNIEFKVENCLQSKDLDANIIINTSCEHMDKDDLANFIKMKGKESLIVLQTNDFDKLDSHINCSNSLEEFCAFVEPLLSKKWIVSKASLDLGDFNRYMIIGQ